jgi:phage-related protein
MKPAYFLGDSRKRLTAFPAEAKRCAGYALNLIQEGLDPSDWKPMPAVGLGVKEIRIHIKGEFRVIYLATLPECVYVLHAFGKKTQRTPKADIDLARTRLRQLLEAKTI